MDKLNKLSVPATIIIGCLILGGFYYLSEANKQKSIERQQQMKIENERQQRLAKELKEEQSKETLDNCIASAKKRYLDAEQRGRIHNDEYCKGKPLSEAKSCSIVIMEALAILQEQERQDIDDCSKRYSK